MDAADPGDGGGGGGGGQPMTAGEAARMLHVSRKTVSRWADKGLIPCVVTLGGHRRFPRLALKIIQQGMRRDGGREGAG